MAIDWEHELGRVMEPGGDRPATDFLGPGRQALRRRRVGVGAASALLVALVVGVGASLGGATSLLGGQPTGAGFAVDPGSLGDGRPVGQQPDWEMRLRDSCQPRGDAPVVYDSAGRLCFADGAEVLDRVDDPLDYAPGRSVAVEVRVDDRTEFVLLAWSPGGSTDAVRDPAVGTLEDWLPGQVVGTLGRRGAGGGPR